MRFVVRWPDERVMSCYSPSLVVREYLEVGRAYALDDFVERSRTALRIASDRVREKYGHACANALGQLSLIEATAERYGGLDAPEVRVEAFDPPE
jgi:uncharacterized repeat protein (TIGR04042 family)